MDEQDSLYICLIISFFLLQKNVAWKYAKKDAVNDW